MSIEKLKKENARMKAKIRRILKAGNAMHDVISEIDPQRIERHRFLQMTDAECKAVHDWRKIKNPDYNRA